GALVIYAGGDVVSHSSGTNDAFTKAFPKINLATITDYSKFHDVRIDNQLAANSLEAVNASLNFGRLSHWESEGKLLVYKPVGFSQINAPFKSSTGAWMSSGTLTELSEFPTTPTDLVDPIYKNRNASQYPHDNTLREDIAAGNKSIAVAIWGLFVLQTWYMLSFVTRDIPHTTRDANRASVTASRSCDTVSSSSMFISCSADFAV
ncbi:unnamed protein product, partial [Aphanomyces euteiches]